MNYGIKLTAAEERLLAKREEGFAFIRALDPGPRGLSPERPRELTALRAFANAPAAALDAMLRAAAKKAEA